MSEAQRYPDGSVAPLVIGGSILVAVTTPLNCVLLLLCWRLIAATAGPYVADNDREGLALLGLVINVGLFLAFCGLVRLAFRRYSLFRQRVAVVAVLVLHLGLWLGLSVALVAQMAATGVWL